MMMIGMVAVAMVVGVVAVVVIGAIVVVTVVVIIGMAIVIIIGIVSDGGAGAGRSAAIIRGHGPEMDGRLGKRSCG
jgi:hypothetical protein